MTNQPSDSCCADLFRFFFHFSFGEFFGGSGTAGVESESSSVTMSM
jgi:hypothetical protein